MARLRFSLAGRIVTKSSHAYQIGLLALRENRAWVVPQARNVMILLRRAGQ